jgi:hypothetical protein
MCPRRELVAYHEARPRRADAIFREATAVHPTGLLTPHAIARFRPDVMPAYRRLASALHAHARARWASSSTAAASRSPPRLAPPPSRPRPYRLGGSTWSRLRLARRDRGDRERLRVPARAGTTAWRELAHAARDAPVDRAPPRPEGSQSRMPSLVAAPPAVAPAHRRPPARSRATRRWPPARRSLDPPMRAGPAGNSARALPRWPRARWRPRPSHSHHRGSACSRRAATPPTPP